MEITNVSKGARETACFVVNKVRQFVCSAATLGFAGESEPLN